MVEEEYFGTRIRDPYRWMEDSADAGFREWLTTAGARARETLDALPDRAELARAVGRLRASTVEIADIRCAAGELYYLKRAGAETVGRLIRRPVGSARESVAADAAGAGDLGARSHTSIDWYTPSPDGRHVALGLCVDGSEDYTLVVVDRAGRPLPGAAVTRAYPMRLNRANIGGVSWAPDSSGLLYLRLREMEQGADPTTRYQDATVCFRSLARFDEEIPVLGRGTGSEVPLEPDDLPMVDFTDGPLVATIAHGSRRDKSLYTAEFTDIAEAAAADWKPAAAPEDRAQAWTCGGGWLYAGGPTDSGWRIWRVPAADPEAGKRVPIASGEDAALEDLAWAAGHLVVRALTDGASSVFALDPSGEAGKPVEAPLPSRCGVPSWTFDAAGHGYLVVSSWVSPPRVLGYDPASGGLEEIDRDTHTAAADPLTARLEFAVASDGARVPLTIVGERLDGRTAPERVILTGYGFFGITLRPTYNPLLRAWTERGGLFVVAHVRGGGDRGEQWYRAGHRGNKERTIRDFLDCARHLVQAGYTEPGLIAAEGVSAGGLTVGGAMLREPGAFGCVIMRVPLTNTLRLEMHENGPPNIPEYGTVRTPDGFAALRISDVYTNVDDSAQYPPVLLTAGLNDLRVLPWQPAKLAARLNERPGSAVLRVEENGGHGVGASADQVSCEFLDRIAFAYAHTTRGDQ